MPELPDIQSYLAALEQRVVDRQLLGIRLNSPFLLRTVSPTVREVEGKSVVGLRRIGKRIVLCLVDDLFVVIHLMIAGRLRWRDPGAKLAGKVMLAAFDFENGTLVLTEASTKKRAALYLVCGESALKEHERGGIEVLDASLPEFRSALLAENHTIKRTLTDPRLFSGIGNAYSDEILHKARLSPFRQTLQMTDGEVERLFEATHSVLREWIDRLQTETANGFPEKVTAFREGMAVHGRYGKPCPDCGSPVQRIIYAENESNYCAACQTGGKLLADRSLSRLLKSDWPRTINELEEHKAKNRV